MKKISIKYSGRILALLVLTQFGCVDLEEVPLDFPGPDNFYNSPSQIQSAFASSGSRLYSAWSVYSYGAYNAFRGTDQLSGGDLVLSASHANELWSGHYRAIADITPVFSALANDRLGSSATQEEKHVLLAEAKFLRAFNYFCLVRMYGPLPIVTEETDVTADEIKRNPISEVYNLVISDLMFAVQHLPDQWVTRLVGLPRARPRGFSPKHT
ncbi:MAG: RagB/SusD family nutrient uptake outer membrane protein [Saprospiraceae bacterium]|nr:RagB/SusD family nutrient uptake outer membrane protein [Saprospiraceae bacterium]